MMLDFAHRSTLCVSGSLWVGSREQFTNGILTSSSPTGSSVPPSFPSLASTRYKLSNTFWKILSIHWFLMVELMSFWSFLQMTLADYSLSDVVFGEMESWKDLLAEAGAFCSADFNNSHSLAAAVQVLEEFIYVARSELADLSWSAQDHLIFLVASHHHQLEFWEREGNGSSKEKTRNGISWRLKWNNSEQLVETFGDPYRLTHIYTF